MGLPSNSTTCLVCGTKLVKNGRHPSGTQRWRCPLCGASSVRRRPDLTAREQLRRFVTWLVGTNTQAETDGTASGRSFRRHSAWCWDLTPRLGPVETIYHAVLVDGIWIGTWCLLIALSGTGRVLAWQWCARETTAAWKALLEQIPAPAVLVSDGGSGLPSALRQCWPETVHQRCLFHLQLNTTRHLTRNPRTTAGRALHRLVMDLSGVRDEQTAIDWQLQLEQWWQAFGHLTSERTLLRNGRFGYTHDRLRKAWLLVRLVVRKDLIFTHITYGNPRTTSALEGLNAQIRDLLRRHRGMTEEHRRRAVEWFLTLHELPLEQALDLARPIDQPPVAPEPDDQISRTLYDTGLDPAEGLWLRTGWAGRG
ncbi:IS1249 family transposase [Microbacterium schleiferi]|uniref:IS1249 family transposase n=1 Tax=Microbacterium schleiferi TaxID=69362 RepID=UPI002EC40F01|nr:IS1249 family transposase [Actinomycetota bacterium]